MAAVAGAGGWSSINAAILFKIVWTYAVGRRAGAAAHLPAVLGGLAVLNGAFLVGAARFRRRGTGRPST